MEHNRNGACCPEGRDGRDCSQGEGEKAGFRKLLVQTSALEMLARGRVGPLRVRVGVLAVKTNITEAENCYKNVAPEPRRR